VQVAIAAAVIAVAAGAAHLAWGATELPRVAPPRDLSLELTLYPDGRSWVREVGAMQPMRGETNLVWHDTPPTLEPDTFTVRMLEGTTRVLEITPPRGLPDLPTLLKRWVGRDVQFFEPTEPGAPKGTPPGRMTSGKLIGFASGKPLLEVNDSLWVDPPGTLQLPIKDDLLPSVEPAHIRLSATGEKGVIEVSYRVPGLSWSVEYSALRGGDKLDLEGWATLRNDTSVAFPPAKVRLLAGDVRRLGPSPPPPGPEALGRGVMMMSAAKEADAAGGTREALGPVHLYTLPDRAHLPASGITRLSWVRQKGIPFRSRYRLESHPGASYGGESGAPPRHPEAIASIAAGAVEQPLPAGLVRLFERDASGLWHEAGESRIVDLPAGAPLELATGAAFDLLAERTQTEQRPAGGEGGADLGCEIRLSNAGKSAATVEVRERLHGRWKIERSSHEARRLDATTAEFRVEVPAGGSATLTYRASIRY
jgi:hypothetical protein